MVTRICTRTNREAIEKNKSYWNAASSFLKKQLLNYSPNFLVSQHLSAPLIGGAGKYEGTFWFEEIAIY